MKLKKKCEQKVLSYRRGKDVIRVAPHIYNTEDDITLAIDTLAEVVNEQS